jgi:hypothetical protein
MSEKKYSAADFTTAQFARSGFATACRSLSGFWRTESGVVMSDHLMAEYGWTPVPAPPARRKITKSKYTEIRDELVRVGAVRGDTEFFVIVTALGVEVVPDPEPTNVERLEALLREADRTVPFAARVEEDSLAKFLDARGVTAPGGEGRG